MGDNARRLLTAVVCGASGALVALACSGMASADPIAPTPPPAPLPAEAAPAAPVPDAASVTAASGQSPLPEGVPHLPSPDAPPPGSTMDPSVQGNEGPNVSYLKDLWHAVQNQEISGKEALIMGLAQRGMNTPYPEQPAGPNVPFSPAGPSDPAAPPPPPGAPPAPAPGPPAPAP